MKLGQYQFWPYSCHGINYSTNDCVIMIPFFPLENSTLSSGLPNGKLDVVIFCRSDPSTSN